MGYRTTKSKIKVENSKTNTYTEFYYHFFRNILLVGIPLVITSAIILSSIHSSATGSGSGTDSLTISISSACTLSSVVDSEHSTNTNVGTYTSDIGRTTITTLCNDGNGYAVYANGYSNNEEGNNKLINADPSYSNHSIETGLNTSGLTSQWAMKLNNIPDDPSPTPPTIESDYNNTYGIVPPYWTKVASRPSGTTDMAQGSSFTTTYAVYASSSQYAGTYQGQVKYLLTHPSTQVAAYYMQEIDKWKNTLALEQSVQAIDMRDGKSYWVTKLKDGHIWMTQNLDFDIDTNTTLNSQTTDLNVIYNSSTGQYAEYNNGYATENGVIYWIPKNTTINFNDTNIPIWNYDKNISSPLSANKMDDTGTERASLGNYYNWTAAIASNDSSSLIQNTLSDISKNPKNSICPKGWRLPTISNESETLSDSTNEFARLNYLYNRNQTTTSAGLLSAPLYFTRPGTIKSQSLSNLNNDGVYHSSTLYSIEWLYRLYFSSSSVQTANDYGQKNQGYSIRCLGK